MPDEAQTPPTDTQTPPLNAEGGAGQASEPVSPPPPKSEDTSGQASEPVPAPAVEPSPTPNEPEPVPQHTTTISRPSSYAQGFGGTRHGDLAIARAKIQETKRKKLDRIMTLFEKQENGSTPSTSSGQAGSPQVTNDEVEKLLHVADATATRYLQTLEKENRIKQTGKTGAAVFYEKI